MGAPGAELMSISDLHSTELQVARSVSLRDGKVMAPSEFANIALSNKRGEIDLILFSRTVKI
jgi:hypothetical protein